jgi:photosystem II stability/assembly factor-like uncharacterized protein
MWAAGGGGIYFYNGSVWTQYKDPSTSSPLSYLCSVDIISQTDGWVVGRSGSIYHWNGSKWTSASSPTGNDLFKVKMTSSTDGWAVGLNGVVLRYK